MFPISIISEQFFEIIVVDEIAFLSFQRFADGDECDLDEEKDDE